MYLLAFLLPWQTRLIIRPGEINGGYSEYLTISLYVTDIILIFLLVLFLFLNLRRPAGKSPEWPNAKILWPLAVWELAAFISIFFAIDKWLAAYRYGLFLAALGLFWLVARAGYNKLKLAGSFLAGIFLQAGLGCWQFLTQSSFANKWLGLAAHIPSAAGTSVVETIGADGIGERWLRAYGGLDHPNILGGVLAISLLLLLDLSLRSRFFKKDFRFLRFLSPALGLVFLACLFFTFSRAAWLGLVAGAAFMLFLKIIKKDWLGQREILKMVLAGSILIFILFTQYGGLVRTRVFSQTRLEEKSTAERIEYLHEAKILIRDNWLFGVGGGNFVLAAARLAPGKPVWDYQPVHNIFLLLWAEIGFLGLVGCLSFLAYIGWKNRKEILNLSILVTLAIIMMLDHWLWSLHFGVLFFWLMMGLIENQGNGKTNYS